MWDYVHCLIWTENILSHINRSGLLRQCREESRTLERREDKESKRKREKRQSVWLRGNI